MGHYNICEIQKVCLEQNKVKKHKIIVVNRAKASKRKQTGVANCGSLIFNESDDIITIILLTDRNDQSIR